MNSQSIENPFWVSSPEGLTAKQMDDIWVEVFTDFPMIVDPGHVFLIGPRGSGKSMMFRYLLPDCQCLARKCTISELGFLGVYVPLKNTNFMLAELQRVEHRHASEVLNSHIMATYFGNFIFEKLVDSKRYPHLNVNPSAAVQFYESVFLEALDRTGAKRNGHSLCAGASAMDVFKMIATVCKGLYDEGMTYAKHHATRTELLPYEGPLCDYLDFLFPILEGLRSLPGLPKGPIYLLVDDAHWLSRSQAVVLNSWVATRTSTQVSLKISTQHDYKTYYTPTGATIDTPHDYAEIDLTMIYTGSQKSKYRERIRSMLRKRLDHAGLNDVSVEGFLPEDEEQEAKIRQIEEERKQKYDRGEGRGYYRSDDALRYARPDFIKSLAGPSKSSSTYSYAGFNQLVHLSSGIARYFIQPVHNMYARVVADLPERKVTSIPPAIQDAAARDEADTFLFSEIEKLMEPDEKAGPAIPKDDLRMLSNLIHALGGLFRQALMSDRSERKVFSIAFSDFPSDLVTRILGLGVTLGYFHRSTLGRKDSRSGGRTRLYVLNRRLAPVWNLDPTGFAGYLFVTNALIEEALDKPQSILRRLASHGLPDDAEPVQIEIF